MAVVPAAEEVVERNSVYRLFENKNYEELDLIPDPDKVRNFFFTFEGQARCGKCGQLWTSNTHRCPSVIPEVVSSRCDMCGMPFRGGNAGRRKKARHGDRCRGESVRAGWEPAPDGTLHCPLCKTPGFNYDTLDAHLTKEGRECDGTRSIERDEREKEELPIWLAYRVFCEACGNTFLSRYAFARHVCGAPYDPIWLGRTNHPDTTKPYIVWCHEDASPDGHTGYGGGQIADDGDGAIPDAVRHASWGIPFSTYTAPEPGTAAQYLEDVRSLNSLVRRRLLREVAGIVIDDDEEGERNDEDEDEDEDDDDQDDEGDDEDHINISEDDRSLVADRLNQYFGGLSAELDVQLRDVPEDEALAVKHERVRQEEAREMEKRNWSALESLNISVQSVRSHKCPGYSFTHGHVPCPYGATLDLGSVWIASKLLKGRAEWSPICFRCHKAAQRLHRWQNRCKYNADGNRMCTVNNCRKPLADGIDCEEHAQARLERRLEAARQRVNRPQKHEVLWKLVSPADIQRWASDLGPIRASWDKHPAWADVLRAMRSGTEGGKAVCFVDTETVLVRAGDDQQRKPLVLELAVIDASGVTKLDTTLQHGDKTVSQLCEGLEERFVAYACRVYGVPDATHKTKGMPIDAAKNRLTALKLSDSLMVEWSMNGWDWRALKHTFGERSVPETYLRGIDLLRMAGYSGPMDLATLFHLLFPDSPLNRSHHEALVDTQKLLSVLHYILTGSVAPLVD